VLYLFFSAILTKIPPFKAAFHPVQDNAGWQHEIFMRLAVNEHAFIIGIDDT
jgi:hypothetical protein